MTTRTFIFCDICNPQGVRTIEFRRGPRKTDRNGRRISDGRSWIEGNLTDATNAGWITDPSGQNICPACQNT